MSKPVCAGDAFAYDLTAKLAACRQRRHEIRAAEDALGARLVCQTPGARPVTEKQLVRHEQLYGSEGVDELLPHLDKSETSRSGLASDGGMRPLRPVSVEDDGLPLQTPRTRNLGLRIVTLHRRGRGLMAIADTLGKADKVVRRYLREAEVAGLLAA